MKFRKDNSAASGAESGVTSSQEMREMAEALGLYRSAMRHVAEKQAARPFVERREPARSFRMRLVLVPALGAALAVAVIVPVMSHPHRAPAKTPVAVVAQPATTDTTTVASVDDTQLMDQIDSDLTEDVPDALQPLADMSEQVATTAKATNSGTISGTEKH